MKTNAMADVSWLAGFFALLCLLVSACGRQPDLYDAVVWNRVDTIREYLTGGGDANAVIERDGQSISVLGAAIYGQREEMALLLFEAGANFADAGVHPGELAREGMDRLLDVVLSENPGLLQEAADVGLPAAANGGHYDAVDVILEHGANQTAAWSLRLRDALRWALAGGHQDIARLMLEGDADVRDNVLHIAILAGSPGMVRELIELGADPSAPVESLQVRGTTGHSDHTPLDYAWRRYSEASDGNAPWRQRLAAARRFPSDSQERERAILIMAELERAGVQIPATYAEEMRAQGFNLLAVRQAVESLTDLEQASEWGYYNVVRRGLQETFSPGDQPLLTRAVVRALRGGNDDVARLLLHSGAEPSVEALHAALEVSSPGMVRLLLELGADPSVRVDGQTGVTALAARYIELGDTSYHADFVPRAFILGGGDACALLAFDEALPSSVVSSIRNQAPQCWLTY